MSKVIITASGNGFFNLSPVGTELAPNVFLKTAVNHHGLAQTTNDGWETMESGMHADFGVSIIAEPINVADPKLGMQVELTVTGVEYYRIENGVKIVTGFMELPEPLLVNATYDQLDVDEYGWCAEIGDGLEDAVRAEGFVFNGGDGDDIFAAHMNVGPIYGDNEINGGAGNDHLTGSLGNDVISGGTGDDFIFDADGADLLRGGRGNDVLELGNSSNGSVARGGKGADSLISGNGDDRLVGNSGSDVLVGGRGEDVLIGGRGRDDLNGGRGDDVIKGGAGSDILAGGDGADTFVFGAKARGLDVISDFTDGEDLIKIRGIDGFGDLAIQQNGGDVMIGWGQDNSRIILEDINVDSLNADDFLF